MCWNRKNLMNLPTRVEALEHRPCTHTNSKHVSPTWRCGLCLWMCLEGASTSTKTQQGDDTQQTLLSNADCRWSEECIENPEGFQDTFPGYDPIANKRLINYALRRAEGECIVGLAWRHNKEHVEYNGGGMGYHKWAMMCTGWKRMCEWWNSLEMMYWKPRSH